MSASCSAGSAIVCRSTVSRALIIGLLPATITTASAPVAAATAAFRPLVTISRVNLVAADAVAAPRRSAPEASMVT
jgi:hypothetical protein